MTDNWLDSLFMNYPALGRHREMFEVRTPPDPGDGRQLEFYPPWEERNPVPGKATVDLYNTATAPAVRQNLVAGDMLHYLGAIDPRTGKPIDSTYWKLKQQLLGTRTPEQKSIDQRAYQHDLPYYESPPPQDAWMQENRGDAYMRGYLTPDEQDDWRNYYTPEQRQILEQVRQYLRRGSIAPGMNR